jgi:hypothetical protein
MRYLFPAAGFVSAVFFVTLSQAAAPITYARDLLPHARSLSRQAHTALTAAASSTADLEWKWAVPTPSGDEFEAVAYGNGTYVAVGTDGAIFSSSDATHWTARQSGLSVGHNFTDVIFANGKFLAAHVGSGTLDLFTSADAKTWSKQTLPQSLSSWFSARLAYANGTYIAVGTAALVSSDGKNWQEHTIAANLQFVQAPVYANGRFVVEALDSVGDPAIYYSSDNGSSWHKAATAFAVPSLLGDVAANGSNFVLLGSDQPGAGCTSPGSYCGRVYTSPDGNAWTQQPDVADSDGFDQSIIWDGSQYLTWSDDNTTTLLHVYTSPDGITWTQGPEADLFVGGGEHSVIAAGGGYVALGNGVLDIETSSDFATWSPVINVSGPAVVFRDIEYLNGAYYSAGFDSDGGSSSVGLTVIMRSTDAGSWTTVYSANTGSFRGVGIDALAYHGGTYVAVGDAGRGLTSHDGVHWTAMAAPPGDQINQLIYADGKFLGVGGDCSSGSCIGKTETSTDGKTWTAHSLPGSSPASLAGVVFDGSKFVAVGFPADTVGVPTGVSGRPSTFTSSDGVTWMAGNFSVPDNIALTHVRLIDGKFYATGFDPNFFTGYLASSADGLSWSGAATDVDGDDPSVSDIASIDGRLYMTSQGVSALLTSTDGSTWSYSAAPSTSYLTAINVQNGSVVAVGGATTTVLIGAIVTAHGGPTATDGSVTTTENTAAKGTLTGSVATGSTPAFTMGTGPAHGTVKITDTKTGAFTYTPKTNYTGKDSFTFAVGDGTAQSAAATESVTVSAAAGGGGSSSGGGGSLGVLMLLGLAGMAATRKRMARG